MKNKSWVWITLGILVVVIIILMAIFLIPKKSDTIKIGAVYPLSGFLSIYGDTEMVVTEFAINEINSNGGINGRNISLVAEDGKCSGQEALTAAKKLIDVDGVKIILGGSCSSETLSIAPYAKENGVILFTSIASSPDISNQGNVLRNTIITSEEGKILADLMARKGKKRIAILTENNDYTLSIRKGLMDNIAPEKIVYNELFNFGEKDFRTYITKVKSTNPDAVFIFSVGGNGGLFLKQLGELNTSFPVYGAENPGTSDFMELAGENINGIVYTDLPPINQQNPKLVEIFEEYSKKGVTPVAKYSVAARYDSIYILKEAIESCGEDTDCILKKVESEYYNGLIGNYTFDENGDMKGLNISLNQILDGRVVPYNE